MLANFLFLLNFALKKKIFFKYNQLFINTLQTRTSLGSVLTNFQQFLKKRRI